MSFLKKILQKPLDTALEKTKGTPLHTQVDMVETILRTGTKTTQGRVHVRDALDTKRMMITVLVALIPTMLYSLYNTGMHTLNASAEITGLLAAYSEPTFWNAIIHGAAIFFPIYIVTMIAGGIVEVVFATIRGHEISEGFLVTSMLIPLIMPAGIPLWMVAAGTVFGIMIGKEVFGGVGYNFLNPALTARAFIFFSYPTMISGDKVWIAADKLKDFSVSGITGATPLGVAAVAEKGKDVVATLAENGYSFASMALGSIPGSLGETSIIAIAIGAVILLVTGVGSWRVMLSTFVGAYVMGLLFNFFAGPETIPFLALPAHYHLVMGGLAFGAVFMTTDPVSAAATPKGQLIYGFLIGVLAIMIRVANPAYPEGVMLAILFMNVFAPLIDHFVVQGNIKRRLARVQG
jgi:Na+-transporting NADH:ubiquinone oxidoreductase subunit B